MNLRHLAPKASALPGCATPRSLNYAIRGKGGPERGHGCCASPGLAARKRCGRRCVAADAGRADNRACPSHAAVAQWIEHRPSKPAVGGSIPSCRAIISDKARPRFDAKGCATLSFTSRRRFEAVRNAWSLGGPQFDGGCSSAGRVPDCDSGCRGFESHQPPHSIKELQFHRSLRCDGFVPAAARQRRSPRPTSQTGHCPGSGLS